MAGNGGMGEIADKTAKDTDEALKEDELVILLETKKSLEGLRPNVEDGETYTRLINAVKEATEKNKDIALLTKKG